MLKLTYLRTKIKSNRPKVYRTLGVYFVIQLILLSSTTAVWLKKASHADATACNSTTDVGGSLFLDTNANGVPDEAIYSGTSGTLATSVGGNSSSSLGNGIDGLMFPLLSNGGSKITNPSSFWGPRTLYSPINPNNTELHEPIYPMTVTIKLYNSSNALIASLPTDSHGSWVVPNIAGMLPLRVEYGNLPTGFVYTQKTDGTTGPQQFINTARCNANSGFYYSSDYCQDNPNLALVCNYGDGDIGNTVQSVSYNAAEKLSDSDNNGVVDSNDATDSNPNLTKLPTNTSILTTKSQTGPVWGLAYQKTNKQLFVTAATVGTGGLATGQTRKIMATPNGAGALYKIDTTAQTPTVSLFYTITGPTTTLTYPTSIGTSGIGDIDFNDDSDTLYAVDLSNRALIQINFTDITSTSPTVDNQSTTNIPDPGCSINNNDTYRPFAIKFWHGSVYVGTSCTNQQKGFVQKYDSNNNSWSTIYTTNANEITKIGGTDPEGGLFTDIGYYAPFFITGLAFDTDGSLLIGTSAGPGHTDNAQGNLYRVPLTNGTWGNANSFQPASQDFYDNVGGIITLPGSGQIVIGSQSPTLTKSNGLAWLNTSIGSTDKKYTLYRTTTSPYDGTLANSNAVGGLALLCQQAPLQLNGRIWQDNNNNNREDAGEPGLAGLTVNLYDDSNVLLGTATTSNTGQWSFGGPTNTNLINNQSIQPYAQYRVVLGNADDYAPNGDLYQRNLVTAHANNTTDYSDSNAQIAGNHAEITTSTSGPGGSLFGLDTGFSQLDPSPTVTTTPTTTSVSPSNPILPPSSPLNPPSLDEQINIVMSGVLPNTGYGIRLVIFCALFLILLAIMIIISSEVHLRYAERVHKQSLSKDLNQ